ncbi:NUDIX domain-containing protein [Heyndrickxia sp. MSNUG]|uniref:NUDIX hydrolase n=1 Tax=Heyndrickxia sp. MSNUG TaxID=3136677 RepID=UPI003C2B3560
MNNENQMIFAVKGVIINAGKVLILKRSEDEEVGGGSWENVGGKIEFGEELEAALMREVKEETGLDIIVERILYATTFKTNPKRQIVLLTYLCTTDGTEISLSTEHMDYLWASEDQLKVKLPQEILRDFERNDVFSVFKM